MASKKTNTADTWVRRELGLGSGPISGTEMARYKTTLDKYNKTVAGGDKPTSQMDWFDKAGTAESTGYNEAIKRLKDAAATKGGAGGGLSALDRYTQQLQGMLTSGTYRQPYDQLQTQLQGLYGQAGGQINTAMDNLDTFLKGQTNPYTDVKAQETQVTPTLNELLQSQGVSTNPLRQLAAVTQAQNAGQATAFNNLIGSLSGIYGANQAGQLGDVAQQRTDLQNQLSSSNLGYGAQLQQKGMDQQQNLMTMLLTALSKGGKPKKGRLF
jgi:hypothetical protein